jgi:hypothetical protein
LYSVRSGKDVDIGDGIDEFDDNGGSDFGWEAGSVTISKSLLFRMRSFRLFFAVICNEINRTRETGGVRAALFLD